MPWPLYDDAMSRCREEEYENEARYFASITLFDCISRRPHQLTKAIANASPKKQDEFFQGLMKIKTAKKGNLSWLDHRICEVVALAQGVTDLHELKDRLGELVQQQLLG